MSAIGAAVTASPRARRIAWLRRRRAFGRAWREYRHHLPGMIGLAILVLAVAMALAAPLLADESGLQGDQHDRTTPRSRARRSSPRSAPTASAATS